MRSNQLFLVWNGAQRNSFQILSLQMFCLFFPKVLIFSITASCDQLLIFLCFFHHLFFSGFLVLIKSPLLLFLPSLFSLAQVYLFCLQRFTGVAKPKASDRAVGFMMGCLLPIFSFFVQLTFLTDLKFKVYG